MKLDHILNKEQLDEERRRLDPKCWKGYKKQGTKMKGDTRVNNCVPEEVGLDEAEKRDAGYPDDSVKIGKKHWIIYRDRKYWYGYEVDKKGNQIGDVIIGPKTGGAGNASYKASTKSDLKTMLAQESVDLDENLNQMKKHIDDLEWDRQRMTTSGQLYLDKLINAKSIKDARKAFQDMYEDGNFKRITSSGQESMVKIGKMLGMKIVEEVDLDEGKSPHKKGTKKYKKHMAAMHAGMGESVTEDDTDYPQVVNRNIDKKNVMDILRKFPAETKKMQMDGDVFAIYDTDLYMALFDYFSEDMPYGTQKGRDGDPVEWINDELDSLGLLDEIVESNELTFEDDDKFFEAFGELGYSIDENDLFEAEYQGRKVKLNKPMQGDVKKFKVYVKDPKTGNVKKVNFGHGGSSVKGKAMKIRKNNPKARKSFRARHNCDNPGPKTKARYWSCRKW